MYPAARRNLHYMRSKRFHGEQQRWIACAWVCWSILCIMWTLVFQSRFCLSIRHVILWHHPMALLSLNVHSQVLRSMWTLPFFLVAATTAAKTIVTHSPYPTKQSLQCASNRIWWSCCNDHKTFLAYFCDRAIVDRSVVSTRYGFVIENNTRSHCNIITTQLNGNNKMCHQNYQGGQTGASQNTSTAASRTICDTLRKECHAQNSGRDTLQDRDCELWCGLAWGRNPSTTRPKTSAYRLMVDLT